MSETPPPVVRVFISCPGDLRPERTVVAATLAALEAEPAWRGRAQLVPYAYENMAPARSGMAAQEVVNSYMLRPEDAEIFICLLWQRMGTPLHDFINPDTNQPYQSGTEYEYLRAYAAAQHAPTPVILLYRCTRPALAPATEEDRQQLARVDSFFARFGPGGDLKGLHGTFADDADLAAVLRRDVAHVLERDLLPLLSERSSTRMGPVVFGLPPLPPGFVARPEAMEALRKALLGSRPAVGVVATTALHGIGGLGKTVLARAAWENQAIRAAFPDGILWATLGEAPDMARLQREWIAALGGNLTAVTSPESGRSELQRLAGERALLLVLDDVWHAEDAQWLEVTGPRVRVLLTTRDAAQVEDASLVPLELMRTGEARALLDQTARGHVADPGTLDAIAERLGYLPLALQVVGALLARNISWPEIERELKSGHLAEVKTAKLSIFAVLAASVRYLPPEARARYRELVIFPRDEALAEGAVARLWARTGGMSAFATHRLLAELHDRSLIQAGETLHDLQVDYLLAEVPAAERRRIHGALCDAYGDPTTWATTLPEDDGGYGWQRLASHLYEAGRDADLATLLTNVTYLERKLARLGTAAVVADLALCPERADIQRISDAIRAGSVLLAEAPEELANQIEGRVGAVSTLHDLPVRKLPYFRLRSPSLLPADPALRRTLTGHSGTVFGCAFSPDGRLALSASEDETLRLWDVATGETVHIFEGHSRPVHGCAFSPDGRHALSASADHTLRLWDVESGETVQTFYGHANFVRNCAFSPDGRLVISVAQERTVRLWDVATGENVQSFWGHSRPSGGCAFSPDGRFVLSGSDDTTLRLWDVESGETVQTFEGHTDRVYGCAFSPDGRFVLSASADHTLRLWDVESGETVRTFEGHTDAVQSCAFSPDGRLALSASEDHTLRLWDVASGECMHTFTGHIDSVRGCAFSPDGRHVLSASADQTLRLWEAASGESGRSFAGHTGGVNGCAFSPDGRLALSASEDETLRLWDVATGETVRTLTGHTGTVNGCAFSPDGRLALSASEDGTLRLWDVASGDTVRTFSDSPIWKTGCAFSPDGRLALSMQAWSDTLQLWDIASGEIVHTFTGGDSGINSCAFSPDGRFVLSISSYGTLRLWEVESGHEVRQLSLEFSPDRCVFSSDGNLALSATWNHALQLWNVANGEIVRTFEGHTDSVKGCAFSPDEHWVLSASDDHTLRLWDAATGEAVAQWRTEVGIGCCAYGPDGRQVLAGDTLGGVHFLELVGVEAALMIPPVAGPSVASVTAPDGASAGTGSASAALATAQPSSASDNAADGTAAPIASDMGSGDAPSIAVQASASHPKKRKLFGWWRGR